MERDIFAIFSTGMGEHVLEEVFETREDALAKGQSSQLSAIRPICLRFGPDGRTHAAHMYDKSRDVFQFVGCFSDYETAKNQARRPCRIVTIDAELNITNGPLGDLVR